MLSEDNIASLKKPDALDARDLEILKFKMIAFVKTYDSEF